MFLKKTVCSLVLGSMFLFAGDKPLTEDYLKSYKNTVGNPSEFYMYNENYPLFSELSLAMYHDIKDLVKKYEDGLNIWYMYMYDYYTYSKFKDDEFEFNDIKNKAKTEFLSKIDEMYNKYKTKEIKIRVNTEFDKFDFEKERFKLNLPNNNSYYSFEDMRYSWETYDQKYRFNNYKYSYNYDTMFLPTYSVNLFFNNTNSNIEYLPMKKDLAKEFVKQRKDSNGDVNRNLTAVITFTSDKYKIKSEENFFWNLKDCKVGEDFKCDAISYDIISKIKYIEIYDKDKLLHTINY